MTCRGLWFFAQSLSIDQWQELLGDVKSESGKSVRLAEAKGDYGSIRPAHPMARLTVGQPCEQENGYRFFMSCASRVRRARCDGIRNLSAEIRVPEEDVTNSGDCR